MKKIKRLFLILLLFHLISIKNFVWAEDKNRFVQVLGKIQKPGNYPGDLPLSVILAEAMDRAPGSNFRISFFNGADQKLRSLRYEDIVKGKTNPTIPPGSILYLPPSASSLFGEMTERQLNLVYLIALTISALGLTAIVRQ